MHILATEARADAAGSLATRYIALAIQGDLQPAHRMFDDLSTSDAPADLDLAMRFRQRFVERSEAATPSSGNALVDRVVMAYEEYWREALMLGAPDQRVEEQLASALSTALENETTADVLAAAEDVFAAMVSAVEAQGFHALVSHAAPLQDLFVWRRQNVRTFEVELTDGVHEVRVAFMSDFASLGWKHYASLGLATTTGWVEGDMLYCVGWAYAPDTENFAVSYLKHETRHLADFERFPGLPSVELEYRAKLTELAFASKTLPRLLGDFSAKGAPNPDSPHAEANWRVVRDVYEALHGEQPNGEVDWTGADVGRLNRVARRLLAEDTARLELEMQERPQPQLGTLHPE